TLLQRRDRSVRSGPAHVQVGPTRPTPTFQLSQCHEPCVSSPFLVRETFADSFRQLSGTRASAHAATSRRISLCRFRTGHQCRFLSTSECFGDRGSSVPQLFFTVTAQPLHYGKRNTGLFGHSGPHSRHALLMPPLFQLGDPLQRLLQRILGVAVFRILPVLLGARLCVRVRARLLLQLSQPPLQRGNLHIAGIRTTRSGLLLRDLLSRRVAASIL